MLDTALQHAGWPRGPYARLDCHGAEPFWGVSIRDGAVDYSDVTTERESYTVAGTSGAAGVLNVWKYELAGGQGGTLIVDYTPGAQCTDSMSDKIWDYTLYAIGLGGAELRYGCCSVAPDGAD